MTARWAVEEIQPHRDLHITWRPISLFFKNEPEPDSKWYEATKFNHGLLRVLESVRTTDGNDGVFKLYWEFGARIHHDRQTPFDPADALATVGLDKSHAAALADESWDEAIRIAMGEGLALVGDDVGTPIIALENSDGVMAGYFGPVISRVPSTEKSLAVWDALVAMMDVDSFFELNRTRTGGPDVGDRPLP
ncbi:MAG: disulfide bond formation protein DsbA, partial [Ilumatobacteraceae bacterium]